MRRKFPSRDDLPEPTRAKDFVKPLTLGDIAAGADQQIEAECEWCRHNARLEVAPLVAKYGPDTRFRDLKAHLVCSQCGWRQVDARPVARTTARGRAGLPTPPLPSLDEVRAVLAAVPRLPGAGPAPGTDYAQHHAYMDALMERWPELGASRALFIVRQLVPEIERARGD